MRAATFERFGGPDVLRVTEREDPRPGAGEVVVKVAFSPVNPTDILMRSGQQAAAMASLSPPYVPGFEFSGHVHALGAGAAALQTGQAVMGIVNARRPAGGAHAQYVVAPSASVVPVDAPLDLAAAVPLNGLTAVMALEALCLKRGDAVLVTGGAGALGGYVIELARQAGLRIVADAKEADVDLLKQRGADEIAPRGEGMQADIRRRFPNGVDGLVDCALLGAPAAALVRDGGAAVALRRTAQIADARLRTCYIPVFERATDTAALTHLAGQVRDGVLTPRIGVRLPLDDIVQAHERVEQGGLRGRVMLTF